MRIALFSWETLHSIAVGGVGVHVSELGAALAKRGHDVHVFTRRGALQPHDALIEKVHYHRCDFELNPSFVDEIDNMCRAFVHACFAEEDKGGVFEIVMHPESGPVRHTGIYQTIDAPHCLAFTWNSPHAGQHDSLVTVEFRPDGKATEVVVTHERLPEAAQAGHVGGWTEILASLAENVGV